MLGRALLVVLAAALVAASDAAAQADSLHHTAQSGDSAGVPTAPPLKFERYTLEFTERYAQRELGAMYRFTKDHDPYVDVFVFPYPDSAIARGADGLADAVKGVAFDFVASLPVMRQSGMIDNYRLAFSDRDSVKVNRDWVHGNFIGAAVKRHGQIFISLFYVFGFPGDLIKIRADLPFTDWRHTDVGSWTHHVIEQMYSHPERRDELQSASALPAKIGEYRLYTTSRMHDSTGVFYRYVAANKSDIRVAMRPLSPATGPATEAAGDSADTVRAANAVKTHTDRLASGKAVGVSDFRLTHSHADTAGEGSSQIGYTAAGTFRCGPSVCLDTYYAYIVAGHVVSCDLDGPQVTAALSDLPSFTHTLVRDLLERRP